MMKYRKILIAALVVLLSFSFGAITQRNDNYFEISKNLDIFGSLYREVNTLYVDGVDPTKMMRQGIDAMLGSLDPYTNYISEGEIEDYRFMSTGQYGGIGATVGKRDGKIIVLEPYQDYPADKSGLIAGDELLKVDEEQIAGTEKSVREVRDLLRGQKGTQVRLTVKRNGKADPIVVALERDRIKIDNVPYYGMATDDIGYISLTGFTQDAGLEVQTALQTLKKDHTLKGVILDLRGNPGGRLDEAVNVSNVFIAQGSKIVETRGKDPENVRSYFAKRPSTDTQIPLAVLVNSRSASASEIVSGSIQDLDRGVIVGSRSFGKGLVQNIRPLKYNTQLKVTTAKYYTPSGRCIQAIDYTHRKEDGSVGKVADSLKSAFYTRNGRVVYDGGGVEPDIDVDKEKLQTVTRELESKGLIFDFATQYVAGREKIADARTFTIDDKTYSEFEAFVKSKNFSYKTLAEKRMETLQEALEKEAYNEDLKEEMNKLASELKVSKTNDLQKHKDEIAELIKHEIIQRYYYKQGVIEASFKDDEDLKSAIAVLYDKAKYEQILAGK